MINTNAKVLIWDIEVLPEVVWGYPTRRNNEAIKLRTIKDQSILSVSSAWLHDYQFSGEKSIEYKDVISFWNPVAKFTLNKFGLSWKMHDDKKLCKYIWNLIDEADVIVHHYGDNFDLPKMMARFMYYGMGRPSPVETIDTKKIYSKIGLPSKKLDEIARYLDIEGKKGSHGDLWFDMYNGSEEAREAMKVYNNQDVKVTAEVLLKVFPYVDNHTSLAKYNSEGYQVCDCGSDKYESRGYWSAKKRFRKKYQCNVCTKWFSSSKSWSTLEEAKAAPKGC